MLPSSPSASLQYNPPRTDAYPALSSPASSTTTIQIDEMLHTLKRKRSEPLLQQPRVRVATPEQSAFPASPRTVSPPDEQNQATEHTTYPEALLAHGTSLYLQQRVAAIAQEQTSFRLLVVIGNSASGKTRMLQALQAAKVCTLLQKRECLEIPVELRTL